MNQITLNFDISKSRGAAEAIKSLRANVQFCGTDVHCIVITSCLPGDGKSTISVGLSIALAQAGKRVLLVDADLRKSVMLKTCTDALNVTGFSEYLSGLAPIENVKCNTQFGNLDIIFCGQYPANPTELLSSSSFKAFVAEQRTEYDYVIVDAPPLGLVVDAAVIASACDSAMLVLPAGKIKSGFANNVLKQLEKSGARVIGAVLNKQPTKNGGYGGYNGYKYSGRYSAKYSADYSAKN